MKGSDRLTVPAALQAGLAERERRELDVPRFEQPDDVTCGPTCLMQVFRYYGDDTPFPAIIDRTERNPDGGTLAVYLGLAALALGYRAALYPFDVRVFDPSWFDLTQAALRAKLLARADAVAGKPKLRAATLAYARFVEQGGRLEFAELAPELLTAIIDRGHPVLCGLSATWLYRQRRERGDTNEPDDVHGDPTGHFVVICGYAGAGRRFMVRDPSSHVPFSRTGRYVVPAHRLINAILLGEITYDAVLLELWR